MRLAFPLGRGSLVTLAVYMDKAGPSDAIPAITVAGIIMDSERVPDFSKKWAAALRSFEDTPFFHMTDYDSGIGLYEDWNARGVKQKRLARLLALVEKNAMAIVGVSVSLADCVAAFDHTPVETAYGIAATHCFAMVPQFRYLQQHPDERVIYTFEAGDQGHGRLKMAYDAIYDTAWRKNLNRIDGDLNVEKKDFPPLQAADVVAFEGWKQWAREHGGDSRPTRYPYARLSKSVASEWATLQRRPMREVVAEMHLPPAWEAAYVEVFSRHVDQPTARLTLPTWG